MTPRSLGCLVTASLAFVSFSARAEEPPSSTIREPSARVHLHSEGATRLEIANSPDEKWMLVCVAPCGVDLPLRYVYRVMGDGVRASGPFRLGARPGDDVTLNATMASRGGFIGGIVLLSLGGFVTFASVVAIGIASSLNQCPTYQPPLDCQNGRTPSVSYAPEAVGIGVGVVMAIVGGALMSANLRSAVNVHIGDNVPSEPPPPPPLHEDTGPARMPRVTSIPLFQGTF